MNTFWKIIGGVALLFVIVIIGLNLYFTDARLKGTIMPHIDEAIDRPVDIESMSLTFFKTFPQPGLTIKKLRIPEEMETDTLVSLDELVVGVRLFPLLRNEINISEIRLVRPDFTYRIFEDGTTNIDFLLGAGEEPAEEQSEGYTIQIPKLSLTDGRFRYDDRASDMNIFMESVSAEMALRYAEIIETEVEISAKSVTASSGGTRYVNRLAMSLKETSTLDLSNEVLSLESGTFSIRGLALNLTGSVSEWSAGAPLVNLSFSSSSDNFGELLQLVPPRYEEQVSGLETRGQLAIDGSIEGRVGTDTPPSFRAAITVTDGYLKNPGLPEPVEQIRISADADNERIILQTFEVRAGANVITADGVIHHPLDEANRSVDLATKLRFDLATIKEFYPINEDTLAMRGMLTAQAVLKGKADQIERAVQSGSINLKDGFINYHKIGEPLANITLESTLQGNRVIITNAGFRSGENDLTLSGYVADYLDENPEINLKLNGKAQFAQIHNYYDLRPAVHELTGTGTLNLSVRGRIRNPAGMAFNGSLNVMDFNMNGDSLVLPVHDLNGELNLTPASANLKQLAFGLGSSDIRLNGSLIDYMEYLKIKEDRRSTPRLTGEYYSRFLNLDEMIDWSDTTTSPTYIELPDLNSSVTARIDTLLVTGVKMTNLRASAATTPEQIELEKASVGKN